MAVTVAVLAGLATLGLLVKPLFGDLEGLQDCLDAPCKSSVAAVLDDFGADLWPTLKLLAWIVTGLAVALGAYGGLQKVFG